MDRCPENGNNQGLLLLATLASLRIAQGLEPDQIELLAAFFTVLGDNLILLAAPAWNVPCQQHTKDTVE